MPPVTLVLPPLTQLNTPYPSTGYLTHFLRGRGMEVDQVDLGIELVDALFCREGLARVGKEASEEGLGAARAPGGFGPRLPSACSEMLEKKKALGRRHGREPPARQGVPQRSLRRRQIRDGRCALFLSK